MPLEYPTPVVPQRMSPEEAMREANHRLRKLGALRAAVQRIQDQRAEQIAEINDWADNEVARYATAIAREEVDLPVLTRVLVEAEPMQRRSVVLAHGTVGFRDNPPKAVVEEGGACLIWLQAKCPAGVRVKHVEEPDLAWLKKHAIERDGLYYLPPADAAEGELGELVPGVHVEQARDVFDYRTK